MNVISYDLPAIAIPQLLERYHPGMNKFKFHYQIEVRFGDLDAYWHVNNARLLVYLEQAHSQYMLEMVYTWQGFVETAIDRC